MKKSIPLLFAVLFCSSAFSAETQIDMAALNAISPIAYEVVKTVEAELGHSFASLDKLKIAMASDDFQNKLQSAMQSFCAKAENAKVLACH